MGPQRFRAVIGAGPRDSAVITMPFDPDEAWGAKADHPVGGTIDGCRIRARLVPAGSGDPANTARPGEQKMLTGRSRPDSRTGEHQCRGR